MTKKKKKLLPDLFIFVLENPFYTHFDDCNEICLCWGQDKFCNSTKSDLDVQGRTNIVLAGDAVLTQGLYVSETEGLKSY
jgi:hypothetical protein